MKKLETEREHSAHTQENGGEENPQKIRYAAKTRPKRKKKTCPLNTSDPENDGSGRVEAPRDPSANPLTQRDGYVIASLGCPVQTPCVNIKLDFPMDY